MVRCFAPSDESTTSKDETVAQYILQVEDLTKEFPGVVALDRVSLNVAQGEIHAVVGENGAGKSTLMKVLSGVYPHGTYEGRVIIDGAERHFRNVRESEEAGVAIIYQELLLVKHLSIAENIFLGASKADRLGVINWDQVNHGPANGSTMSGWKNIPQRSFATWGLRNSSWSKSPKHSRKTPGS